MGEVDKVPGAVGEEAVDVGAPADVGVAVDNGERVLAGEGVRK